MATTTHDERIIRGLLGDHQEGHEALDRLLTARAGRPRALGHASDDELREAMVGRTTIEAAAVLGVSRTTLTTELLRRGLQ